MDPAEALASWLRLTLIPGLGGQTQRKLLKAFGLPEAIFGASRSALRELIGDQGVELLLATDNHAAIAKALAWSESAGHHLVSLADSGYPQALLEIPDPPSLLYVHGSVELLNRPTLAIVGSRNPTPQGAQNAERFAASLAEAGLAIASGLARGIDAAAHRGALSTSHNTLAIIGTGIDRIYPAANQQLAYQIAAQGAIVSEFPLGIPPTAANFPRRNRLISGCSRGTLVVEATVQSGSLITARLAAEQGREVFAIPGSIHSPQARGCHKLIRQGAKLVETVEDVLEELRWPTPAGPPASSPEPTLPASALLSAMGFDPCTIDELASRSALNAEVVSVLLLHLEVDGQVASLPGGRYQRITQA